MEKKKRRKSNRNKTDVYSVPNGYITRRHKLSFRETGRILNMSKAETISINLFKVGYFSENDLYSEETLKNRWIDNEFIFRYFDMKRINHEVRYTEVIYAHRRMHGISLKALGEFSKRKAAAPLLINEVITFREALELYGINLYNCLFNGEDSLVARYVRWYIQKDKDYILWDRRNKLVKRQSIENMCSTKYLPLEVLDIRSVIPFGVAHKELGGKGDGVRKRLQTKTFRGVLNEGVDYRYTDCGGLITRAAVECMKHYYDTGELIEPSHAERYTSGNRKENCRHNGRFKYDNRYGGV